VGRVLLLVLAAGFVCAGCGASPSVWTDLPPLPPGTFGGGGTFVTERSVAGDMSVFRRLPPVRLPRDAVDNLRGVVEDNHAGRPLVDDARLLLAGAAGSHRLYAVRTTKEWACAVLEPEKLAACNGLHWGEPRVYPFYLFDNGQTGAGARLVVFGLVPDRARGVEVVVGCRRLRAAAGNDGFVFDRTGRGLTADAHHGFVFHLSGGRVKRQVSEVDSCRAPSVRSG
jgi:hypothetical protein